MYIWAEGNGKINSNSDLDQKNMTLSRAPHRVNYAKLLAQSKCTDLL